MFSMPILLSLALVAVACVVLGYLSAPLWAWSILAGVVALGLGLPWPLLVLVGLALGVANVRVLRQRLMSAPVMWLMKKLKFLPAISRTEREALEAGTVWADGELFSGQPDFAQLLAEPYPALDAEAQAFLDGPVEELCRITDDWRVWEEQDLPQEVWDFMKAKGFFGLIIPESYGGMGFTASETSAVISKLSSRSMPLGITAMVPNSLGPAELLHQYGTQAQKDHYLPRLADGREIPCFALTEPGAGSDAGAMAARGEVFEGDDGRYYLRLSWNKRYITLAAVATLLGLAFKLRDPRNLLGKGENLGITCALIPTDTLGVRLGERHDPLGVPFYNCPTHGEDVVVPVDAIIGGPAGAGRGWQMLMECLAAGRGIMLPASAASGAKMTARVAGAYASIRKQFGLSIGKFEGVQEPLARIGGAAYILEAARRFTCGGLDGGGKPAVVTAIMKYNSTEICRKAINDAMDVVAGAGISRGPRNLLAHSYVGMPISITVEGANILTRTLMIFGQGAIRCHPFAYREINAVAANDLVEFDAAFWGHVGHVVRNGARSLVLSLTRARFARTPVEGPAAQYYRKLAWSSASFAFLADISMALLGGDLKRRETITGRFSDIFSWMYLGNAVLRRFEAEGRQRADLPFLHWSMQHALHNIQEGFDGLFRNLDVPLLGWAFKGPIAFWSRLNTLGHAPSDELGGQVARALQVPGEQRERLTAGLYVPTDREEALGRIEHAFQLCFEADAVAAKIKDAVRARKLPPGKPLALLDQAEAAGVITADEVALVKRAEEARDDAIQVDAFSLEEYAGTQPSKGGQASVSMAS
jgi:acyl-CoA dehydrogenase